MSKVINNYSRVIINISTTSFLQIIHTQSLTHKWCVNRKLDCNRGETCGT